MEKQETAGLTRWIRHAVTAEGDALAPYRDRIMLSMGGMAVVLLTPFMLNNFVQGRWLLAVIILVIQSITFTNVYAVWRGWRAPIPSALLMLPFVAGITAAVVVQGVPGVLWSYPVIVYCYFIVSRRVAIVCSLVMLVYFSGLAAHYIEPALALRLFATLLLTIVMINIVLSVIADLHKILANQALTDPLTGIFNRRFMDQCLVALVARAQRRPIVAAMLMIDADHFKQINDDWGHDQGDRVLQRIVQIVGARMRQGEKLFRWGGEEFVLLLEEADAEGAMVVAEDIRRAVEAADILPGRRVTVSIGVSQYQDGQTVEAWTKAADAALYQAKAAGRNRVVRESAAESAELVA